MNVHKIEFFFIYCLYDLIFLIFFFFLDISFVQMYINILSTIQLL